MSSVLYVGVVLVSHTKVTVNRLAATTKFRGIREDEAIV